MNNEPNLTELIIKRINQLCQDQKQLNNKKVTPYKISKNGGFNPRTLNHIMNKTRRDIRLSTISKICRGLEISIKNFFDDDLFN